jgi:S1-C subfamily serine protease
MRKIPLYSSSSARRPLSPAADTSARGNDDDAPTAAVAPRETVMHPTPRARFARRSSIVGFFAALAVAALVVGAQWRLGAPARTFTQKDIDAAVLHTLETKALPSPAARAYEAVRPSVVMVRGQREGDDADIERSIGTGVVIVDSGVILTNLHVVAGADKISLRFADGTESDASVVSIQPENDLAVLQAKTLPDDLQAATMRSTGDLAPGDQVVAVGFPFGIGPSASAGVVSGLRREFRSPHGKQVLTNLIQFDAAANPGNSGGPLVTMEGEVVGIVTAILNPGEQRTFIGIGFAVPIENAASGAGLSPF